MRIVFLILHIIVAILLGSLILLQNSKGGIGGGLGNFEHYRTKRGAERALFLATAVLAVIFLFTSVANLIVR